MTIITLILSIACSGTLLWQQHELIEPMRAGWRSLTDQYRTFCGSGVVTFSQTLDDKSYRKTFSFFQLDECRLFRDIHEEGGHSEETVRGLNAKYRFELERNSDAPWKMSEITLGEARLAPGGRPDPWDVAARLVGQALGRIGGGALVDIWSHPDLEIVSTQPTEILGHAALIVSFRFPDNSPYSHPSSYPVASGEVVVAPAQGWRAFRHLLRYQPTSGALAEGQVEVTVLEEMKRDDGLVLPRRLVCLCDWRFAADHTIPTLAGKVNKQRFEYEFEIAPCGTNPRDFTLSAFGLPEPYGVEWDRPTPWWLYALISAGVLFIVTVIVSFWKRRLAARSAG